MFPPFKKLVDPLDIDNPNRHWRNRVQSAENVFCESLTPKISYEEAERLRIEREKLELLRKAAEEEKRAREEAQERAEEEYQEIMRYGKPISRRRGWNRR